MLNIIIYVTTIPLFIVLLMGYIYIRNEKINTILLFASIITVALIFATLTYDLSNREKDKQIEIKAEQQEKTAESQKKKKEQAKEKLMINQNAIAKHLDVNVSEILIEMDTHNAYTVYHDGIEYAVVFDSDNKIEKFVIISK